MGEALECAVHHHVERDLGLSDPSHAVGETGRSQAGLAGQMALATASEHVLARDA